jgi:hypothetical protein
MTMILSFFRPDIAMSDKPSNPHWGSTLDDFLDEEGIREEATV